MSSTDPRVLSAMKDALERDPRNAPLWSHYASLLAGAGRTADAAEALRTALGLASDDREIAVRLVRLLRESGELAEAVIRAEDLLAAKDDPALRLELARIQRARGRDEEAAREYAAARQADPTLDDPVFARAPSAATDDTDDSTPPDAGGGTTEADAAGVEEERDPEPEGIGDGEEPALAAAGVDPDAPAPEDWVDQFEWGDLRVTFDDVAGLDEVKDQIHLRIIAPFKQPEIYRAFGREGGGGILLYGPPGCGKTYIARATAGECGARFVAVGIADIVDKYWGESEKMMHALFEEARRRSPTVLFFDEFDALGSSRGRSESQFWKTLVDQLLQEMDGVGGRNADVLVFAATNVPWNVDSAFRRPGRFDRVVFVPPPDRTARERILARHVGRLPGGERIDTRKLARATSLFTGADLKALVERAAEDALARSLRSGEVHEVTGEHFRKALATMQSTASEWLATARNYAHYANEGGQYDELADFLKRVKKW